MSNLASFGSAERYNRLKIGSIVSPKSELRPRPTYALILDTSSGSRTIITPLPSLSGALSGGDTDWLAGPGSTGTVVVVPGEKPSRVIITLPRLTSVPTEHVATLPTGATVESWLAAGLKLDQVTLWSYQKHKFNVRARISGAKYRIVPDGTGGEKAELLRRNSQLDPTSSPFTEGLLIQKGEYDFAVIRVYIDAIRMGAPSLVEPVIDQPKFVAGDYVLESDLICIAAENAYIWDQSTPIEEAYINRNVAGRGDLPTTKYVAHGAVPSDLVFPAINAIVPASGGPGTLVRIDGTRLGRTSSVEASSQQPTIVSKTDTMLEIEVPDLPAASQFLVKTPYGWVVSADSFTPDGREIGAQAAAW